MRGERGVRERRREEVEVEEVEVSEEVEREKRAVARVARVRSLDCIIFASLLKNAGLRSRFYDPSDRISAWTRRAGDRPSSKKRESRRARIATPVGKVGASVD